MVTAAGMPLDYAAGLLTIPDLSQYESLPSMSAFSQFTLDPASFLRFGDDILDVTRRFTFEDIRASQYVLKVQWRIAHIRHRNSAPVGLGSIAKRK
ncbi:MAG: hypothetical protein M3Z19_01220 [Chloroflexota bacterium]|nr:hypothetical protein [Chloroflexota bacterium]